MGIRKCLVLTNKEKQGSLGKHEAHPAHDWWYTTYGGGHQLYDGWQPDGHKIGLCEAHDSREGYVKQWHCPGRDD